MLKNKLNEPSPIELKAEKWLNRAWKTVKKESIKLSRYLFFYQPESKMDAILHIITIICYIFIGWRLSQ